MTREEMKKKIIEVLDENIRWEPYYFINRGIVFEDDLKNIADALIEARIGDVEEAEYRAEVAERALRNKCKNVCSSCGVHQSAHCKGRAFCEQEAFERCLKQAEKEFWRGRKDEYQR